MALAKKGQAVGKTHVLKYVTKFAPMTHYKIRLENNRCIIKSNLYRCSWITEKFCESTKILCVLVKDPIWKTCGKVIWGA